MRVPRSVAVLGLVSFFMDVASEMVYPLLPFFLTVVLGAGKETVGLIEGLAEGTASLLKVVGGRLSDRLGVRKPFLIAGYGLPALVRPLLALAAHPWQVLGFRLLDRTGKGLRTAPRDALIADVSQEADYGKAYGLHRALDTLGAAIGPLLAFALLPLLGYRGVFWLSLLPAAAAAGVVVFFVRERRVPPAREPLLAAVRNPPYLRFLLASAVFTLGYVSVAFLLLRLGELGLSPRQTTLAYAGYNLLYAALAYPMGTLADRLGPRRATALAMGAYAAVFAGWSLAPGAAAGLALFAAYAAFIALFEPARRAYLAQVAPERERAGAIGLFHTVEGVLLFPASAVFGWLWQVHGHVAAFGLAAGLALLGAALLLRPPR
ncbi:MFS transporter [Oceanithermus profundus]|uniref:MFS transporter n=1 Tax=Oceanithermus profundus TaxID=187137 RepID=UPI0002FA4124|nr:MFS transporter [Oceanithermus profundus]